MEAPLPGAPAGSGPYRRESTGDQINTQKKGKSHNERRAWNSQTAHCCKHLDGPERTSLVSQGFFKLEKTHKVSHVTRPSCSGNVCCAEK